MYENNDKYETLYKVNVSKELPRYLINKSLPIVFLNDASCFGIGSSLIREDYTHGKIMAITLGTGFGAAFIRNQLPLVDIKEVPENGCLWDKAFRTGIADEFFSTRWFLSRYKSLAGVADIQGVKDIVALNDKITFRIFDEFGDNLGDFLIPYLKEFNLDLLVIGGNIARSHHLFLPRTYQIFKNNNCFSVIEIVEETDRSIIIGASFLFHPELKPKIQKSLPNL